MNIIVNLQGAAEILAAAVLLIGLPLGFWIGSKSMKRDKHWAYQAGFEDGWNEGQDSMLPRNPNPRNEGGMGRLGAYEAALDAGEIDQWDLPNEMYSLTANRRRHQDQTDW